MSSIDVTAVPAAPRVATGPRRRAPAGAWSIFWISSIAVFLVSLDTTMLYAVFDSLRAGFHDATAADVDWRFGDKVTDLTPEGDVFFASGRRERYDVVVGADGVRSGVRQLAFGPHSEFVEPCKALADVVLHEGPEGMAKRQALLARARREALHL